MKKPIILFLFALLLGISFSCNSDSSSDDKENDSELLVGKWIPIKNGTILENGNEELHEIPDAEKCGSGFFEYLSDGTFNSLRYEFQDNKCVSYNKKGTWSLKDKILTSNFDNDGTITLEILELNKSTLKIKQTFRTPSILLILIGVYSRK